MHLLYLWISYLRIDSKKFLCRTLSAHLLYHILFVFVSTAVNIFAFNGKIEIGESLMDTKRLLDLRELNNFFQKDIAEKIGISQQTYSVWENGTKIIPLKHLNTVCNIYHVSMDYVLGLSNQKSENSIVNVDSLNKIEIGKRLKEIREENGLTLRTLANELNTTFSTISAYETGKTLILTAFAYQICQKYGISMDWLCGKSKVKYLNRTS